jgi:hypothetical protein
MKSNNVIVVCAAVSTGDMTVPFGTAEGCISDSEDKGSAGCVFSAEGVPLRSSAGSFLPLSVFTPGLAADVDGTAGGD